MSAAAPRFAMEALSNATTFTSPLANANLKIHAAHASGLLGRVLAHFNIWTGLLTLLLLLVTYDQGEQEELAVCDPAG